MRGQAGPEVTPCRLLGAAVALAVLYHASVAVAVEGVNPLSVEGPCSTNTAGGVFLGEWAGNATVCYANAVSGLANLTSFSYLLVLNQQRLSVPEATAYVLDPTTLEVIAAENITAELPVASARTATASFGCNATVELNATKTYWLAFCSDSTAVAGATNEYAFVANVTGSSGLQCNPSAGENATDCFTSLAAWQPANATFQTTIEYDCTVPYLPPWPSASPSPSASSPFAGRTFAPPIGVAALLVCVLALLAL